MYMGFKTGCNESADPSFREKINILYFSQNLESWSQLIKAQEERMRDRVG